MKPIITSLICLLSFGVAHAQFKSTGLSDLKKKIDPLLTSKAMGGTKMSVLVEMASGGDPLYSVTPQLSLHPASNTKLVTTAVALRMLGSTYRWQTQLVADTYKNGVANTLYLVGRGDPRFVSESLWKLIDDARFNGLKSVTGDLVVDDSWFTPQRMAPGFNDKDQDSAYRAATGAVSLNFNSVSVKIKPGLKIGDPPRVTFRPDSGHIILHNTATTTRRGRERLKLSASAEGDRTAMKLSGTIPVTHRGLTTRRRIDNPPLYAGHAARLFLERAGITVGGQVIIGRAPKKRRLLARLWSRTLAEIIEDVNKLSNNFMAEHLVRTIGAEKGSSGDWTVGTRIVSRYLRKHFNIDGFSYVNGSGLFGKTAFSAQQLVDVLRGMWSLKPPLPEYIASLAVNGKDGTLRRRMKGMDKALVRAKTGTLDGVVCLSGYFHFADGQLGLFSILINDINGRPWPIWKTQDEVLRVLTNYTPKGKFKAPKLRHKSVKKSGRSTSP